MIVIIWLQNGVRKAELNLIYLDTLLPKKTVERITSMEYFLTKQFGKITTLVLSGLLLFSLAACAQDTKAEPKYSNYEGDAVVFTLPKLEAQAEVIARIEVQDDLTTTNSRINYADEGQKQGVGRFYSLRKVKVLETFKSSAQQAADTLLIRDVTALAEDGSILTFNDNRPLKKGKQYIVFLGTAEGSDELGILSADNGVFEVEKSRETNFEPLRSEVLAKYLP